MIVRGIVEDVFKNQAKVRIPIFDQVYEASLGVEFNSLSDATICIPPKFKMNLKKGDLVFITFEDNDRYKPIIVGYIYNEENSGRVFKQWKKGLSLAKGDLLWIAERDD